MIPAPRGSHQAICPEMAASKSCPPLRSHPTTRPPAAAPPPPPPPPLSNPACTPTRVHQQHQQHSAHGDHGAAQRGDGGGGAQRQHQQHKTFEGLGGAAAQLGSCVGSGPAVTTAAPGEHQQHQQQFAAPPPPSPGEQPRARPRASDQRRRHREPATTQPGPALHCTAKHLPTVAAATTPPLSTLPTIIHQV